MPDNILIVHTLASPADSQAWQRPACEIWTSPEHVAKNVLDREYLRGVMCYTWKFNVKLAEEFLPPGTITSRITPRKDWF